MKKITSAEAKELNQNFIKTRAKAVDAAIGKKDAISSWFSLEELKEYIAYIEGEGKSKGITIDGLRVYFGAYSKNDKNPTKDNFATVFFAPTQAKKGTGQEENATAELGSSDVLGIDALNNGGMGQPPSAEYPQ